MTSSEAVSLLLAIGLDLQIKVCAFLHPSSILALRMTCKDLQLTTKQRIIWIDALHRVCIHNTLFLASFPIPDMSDLELEQAAIAPYKWIKICADFSKQHSLDETLLPTTTKKIQDPLGETEARPTSSIRLFLVPGGRYLVRYSPNGMAVFDLGYTPNADPKLLASVGPEGGSPLCLINSTLDGMGLILVTFPKYESCSVYEIYPQSETPQLTEIAHLEFAHSRSPQPYLLPNKVIWHKLDQDKIIFRVWDYRLDHSINFSSYINVNRFTHLLKIIATDTRIIAICNDEIFVWEIPPLLPQPPDFFDEDPTHIVPLFQIRFPNNFMHNNDLHQWESPTSWYSRSSQALYFNAVCQDLKIHDFEIDLNNRSLHIMNTCQIPLFDPNSHPLSELDSLNFQSYGFYEDTLISLWDIVDPNQCRVHIRSMLSHPTKIISPGVPLVLNILLSGVDWGQHIVLCPASGRAVHVDRADKRTLVIVDFL